MWRYRSIDIVGIAAEWKGEICMFIIICLQCYYHTYLAPDNEINYDMYDNLAPYQLFFIWSVLNSIKYYKHLPNKHTFLRINKISNIRGTLVNVS